MGAHEGHVYVRLEYPLAEIVELQQLVTAELTILSPVLVYLHQADVEKAIGRLPTFRDERLLAKDLETTSRYPWFQSRGLSNLHGWVEFFKEWVEIAEVLFREWPYRKLRVENAYLDWKRAYQQIYRFLQI